jgi:hypothetical protein
MRQTAQWVADLFGEAAANSLFTVNGGRGLRRRQPGGRKEELLGSEWPRVDLNQALIHPEGNHTKAG